MLLITTTKATKYDTVTVTITAASIAKHIPNVQVLMLQKENFEVRAHTYAKCSLK